MCMDRQQSAKLLAVGRKLHEQLRTLNTLLSEDDPGTSKSTRQIAQDLQVSEKSVLHYEL